MSTTSSYIKSPQGTNITTIDLPSIKLGQRFAFLDVLRGIAALCVVAQHSFYTPWSGYDIIADRYFNLGQFGVAVFFLVSGFIIPYSLERSGSNLKFWTGRIFRLFPLYLTCLIVVLMFARNPLWAFEPQPAPNITSYSKYVISNIFMVAELTRTPTAIPVSWTLCVEMVFYMMCSLLFFFKVQNKTELWTWVVICSIALLLTLGETIFHKPFPESRSVTIVSAFVGTLIFRICANQAHRLALYRVLVAVLILFLAEFYTCYVLETKDFTFLSAAITWSAAYLFFFIIYSLRDIKWPSFLIYLGKISYSIYLSHEFLIRPMQLLNWGWLGELIYLLAVVALSSATYHFIEAPGIRLGKYTVSKLLHRNEDELAAQTPM